MVNENVNLFVSVNIKLITVVIMSELCIRYVLLTAINTKITLYDVSRGKIIEIEPYVQQKRR